MKIEKITPQDNINPATSTPPINNDDENIGASYPAEKETPFKSSMGLSILMITITVIVIFFHALFSYEICASLKCLGPWNEIGLGDATGYLLLFSLLFLSLVSLPFLLIHSLTNLSRGVRIWKAEISLFYFTEVFLLILSVSLSFFAPIYWIINFVVLLIIGSIFFSRKKRMGIKVPFLYYIVPLLVLGALLVFLAFILFRIFVICGGNMENC